MSNKCPECGSEWVKDYCGGKVFACGSIDQTNSASFGRFRQSELCKVNTQLAAAHTRIAELEAFVKEIRDNYDCEHADKYYTKCRSCDAREILLNSGTAGERGKP